MYLTDVCPLASDPLPGDSCDRVEMTDVLGSNGWVGLVYQMNGTENMCGKCSPFICVMCACETH